jgi:hypothetical protein
MKRILQAALLASALCGVSQAALASDTVSVSRNIDAHTVKVNLDGLISLKLKQGPAALTLYGSQDDLNKVIVEQSGDTLHIGTNLKGIHFGKHELRAELTLPNLNEMVSGGVGAAEVSGFSGDTLRVALEGAGAVKVQSQYKNMDIKLGGVGAMNVDVNNSENVDLKLNGAGHMEITGHSKTLRAHLGGVGSLDAHQLQADQVDVNMSGLGSASVYAITTAKLNLTGMGSATVYGKPANRTASARGLGGISWQ